MAPWFLGCGCWIGVSDESSPWTWCAGWVPPSVSSRSVEEEDRAGQAVPDDDSVSDQSASDPAEPESGNDGEGRAEIPPQAEDGTDAGDSQWNY